MLPLTPKDAQGQGWSVPQDLMPFKSHALIPVLATEAGRLAGSMPLAVLNDKLVAVTGTQTNYNLFINAKGQWMGHVLPQWFETYPFFLQPVGDKAIPCFDTDSGWLTPDTQGEAFFNDNQRLNPKAQQRVQKAIDNFPKKQKTDKAMSALKQANVLMPWPQSLIERYQIDVPDLMTLDEKALSQLDDDAYLALRKVGAIALGYAISFSLNQLHLIERLSRLNGQRKSVENVDLETFFGEEEDSLKF